MKSQAGREFIHNFFLSPTLTDERQKNWSQDSVIYIHIPLIWKLFKGIFAFSPSPLSLSPSLAQSISFSISISPLSNFLSSNLFLSLTLSLSPFSLSPLLSFSPHISLSLCEEKLNSKFGHNYLGGLRPSQHTLNLILNGGTIALCVSIR